MRPQHDYDAVTRCDNCGARRKAGHLDHIEGASERLYAGEEVPAGQCPDCGCCCFLVHDRCAAVRETDQRRADFAAAVLHLMEAEREWSADTLDEVARLARERDLGHNDHEGFFKAGPKPVPSWVILTEWSEGDHPVKWEYRYFGDGEAQHRITYGKQSRSFDRDTAAGETFGLCVRHSLECIGAFSEGPR